MISIDGLAVEFSGQTLFSDVSFAINPDDKIALMGKNGAGKSTLMKIIAGVNKPTRGSVRAPKDAVIAYLPQHLLTEDTCTVFEETSKAFQQVISMQEEMDRLAAHLEQLAEVTRRAGPIGRHLDFLAQELLRELNTLCAKCRDTRVVQLGLDARLLCEQIREQVLNVE